MKVLILLVIVAFICVNNANGASFQYKKDENSLNEKLDLIISTDDIINSIYEDDTDKIDYALEDEKNKEILESILLEQWLSKQYKEGRIEMDKDGKYILDKIKNKIAIILDGNNKPQLAVLDDDFQYERVNHNKTIRFYLYTSLNKTEPERLYVHENGSHRPITNSSFNHKLETIIIIHGFRSTYKSEFSQGTKNAYLKHGNYNVIVVDWGKLSDYSFFWYYSAKSNTQKVGAYTARLIEQMVKENKLNLKKVHFVGHSLGAHTSAIASKHVNHTLGKIARITGLDPAGFGYPDDINAETMLHKNDATFVDIIHTETWKLGYKYTMGDADFFPNGGNNPQPGCDSFFYPNSHLMSITQDIKLLAYSSCSHGRAWEFFIESIGNKNSFSTNACKDLNDAVTGTCNSMTSPNTPHMGEYASNISDYNIFYTKTHEKAPFSY